MLVENIQTEIDLLNINKLFNLPRFRKGLLQRDILLQNMTIELD